MNSVPSDMNTSTHAHKLLVHNVSKSFRINGSTREILRDISLEIDEGNFVCILGESGCGKTTLLKLVAGLEECSTGRITLDGQDVTGPHHTRCLVFQKPSLFPWLTVARNISLGPDLRGEQIGKEDRVAQAIRLVGLEGFERYLPSQLSGGMAQRVALARALVNQPQVLLLDEPFGPLDAVTRARMQEEILRIWEARKCTTVFVTHDIDEAILLGTHVVVVAPRPGRVKEVFGVPLTRPRVRTSREFLSFRSLVAEIFFSTVNGDGNGCAIQE